ncbi:MAG: hypothetical protein FJZ63_07765, partial [Chlamydiae bacterium]|nr:hypothetical protein [Chlamydiota bacterium]
MSIESNTIIPKSQFLKTNETFWPYKSMRERKIHNTFLSILPKLMKYVVVGNSLVRKVFDKEGRSVCNYHIYNWEQLYSDLTDAEKRALGGTKAGVLARLEAIFREKKQIDVNGEEYQWTTEAIEKFDTIRKEHTHHRAFKSSGEILDIDWQGVQKE